MIEFDYELGPGENMNSAMQGDFHVVKFRYEEVRGHFSITEEYVYLCLLDDVPLEELGDAINRGNFDPEVFLSRSLPNHAVNLDRLMEEIEEQGLPAGSKFLKYLTETQGKKFSDNFYAKLERGLRLDGSEIQFGIPNPLGPLIDVLESRGYRPLITEDDEHFGEVHIYARSIFEDLKTS